MIELAMFASRPNRTRRFSTPRPWAVPVLAFALGFWPAAATYGQLPSPPGQYQPLDQNVPVGATARWMAFREPNAPPYFQPVAVSLPTTGQITFLTGRPENSPTALSPAQAGLMVGHTYRLRITNMPEYPGVELFPSIEMLDRLHPPRGKEHDFPIPIELTREEIDLALSGQLVTKAIYLEQPSLAAPLQQDRPIPVQVVPANVNLLVEADRAGRPMALVRLGGRLPNFQQPEPGFFGSGAPVAPSVPKAKPKPPEAAEPAEANPEEPVGWQSPERSATGEANIGSVKPAGHVRVGESRSGKSSTGQKSTSRLRIRGAISGSATTRP